MKHVVGFSWVVACGLLLVGCGDTIVPPEYDTTLRIAVHAGDKQVAAAGTTLSQALSVRVTNPTGRPASNVTVRWRTVYPDGAEYVVEQVTDTAGVATILLVLSMFAGVHVTTASLIPPFSGSVRLESVGQIQGATQIAASPMDRNLADTVRATLQPYKVLVRDHLDRPVAGVRVRWLLVAGGGSVQPEESVTDAQGTAQTIHTVGDQATNARVLADIPGLAGSPINFATTVRSGNPVSFLKLNGDGQVGTVGRELTPYAVRISDAYGNGVTGQRIEWTVSAGGGALSTFDFVTGLDGAAFAIHRLGPSEGAQHVTATATALIGSPQLTFTATALSNAIVRVVSTSSSWDWDNDYGEIDTGYFTPDFLAVNPGNTVWWIWQCDYCTGALHRIVFEKDPDDSTGSPEQRDGRWSRTFHTKGTFRYRCLNHSTDFLHGMVGEVVVF